MDPSRLTAYTSKLLVEMVGCHTQQKKHLAGSTSNSCIACFLTVTVETNSTMRTLIISSRMPSAVAMLTESIREHSVQHPSFRLSLIAGCLTRLYILPNMWPVNETFRDLFAVPKEIRNYLANGHDLLVS